MRVEYDFPTLEEKKAKVLFWFLGEGGTVGGFSMVLRDTCTCWGPSRLQPVTLKGRQCWEPHLGTFDPGPRLLLIRKCKPMSVFHNAKKENIR